MLVLDIVAILLGAFFIYTFLINGIDGQRIGVEKHSNKGVTYAERKGFVGQALTKFETEYRIRHKVNLLEQYRLNGEITNQKHTEMINRYLKVVHLASSRIFMRTNDQIIEETSIVGMVSENALYDVRKYAKILFTIKYRLELCQKYSTNPVPIEIDADFFLEKPYVLIQHENIVLYQKIQKYLELGKNQQATMMFIDQCRIFIFKMSILCANLYQTASQKNQIIEETNRQIDVSKQNIERIISLQPKLAYEIVETENLEL